MKRATISFPDALERKLEAYLAAQRPPPSLSTLVQVALEEYLENQKWAEYNVQPAHRPFKLTVAEEGSGENDVSSRHDEVLAEAAYARNSRGVPREADGKGGRKLVGSAGE